MSNNKSLRDIWTVTDKHSMEVSRAAGGVPESCSASVITTASSKEKCESYITNQTQESYLKNDFDKLSIPHGLFLQSHKENVDEDETMSLMSSIWTPTIKDECVVRKDYQKNPLLVVKIPGKDAQQNESKLTVPAEDSYEKLLEISSDSELSNNCGSDESQDELNDETFGESNPVESEMTMSNISEVTANCEMSKRKLRNVNCDTKKSESTDSDNSTSTIIEINGAKSPRNELNNICTKKINSQAKIKQNNVKTPHIKNSTRRHRRVDNRALSSKFSPLGMESNEVLSVSTENLTIQESHSSRRHGGRTSNVKKNIAFETREVCGRGGKTKKITYVRGKIVEETNGPPNTNSKWNTNLCNLNVQRRKADFPDNSLALSRAPQNKLVTNHLYNTKGIQSPTIRQFKNGRLVVDDCLKMNEYLNFIRQDKRDSFFKPPKKDFEILKKETERDPFYEPRYIADAVNYQRERVQKVDRAYEPRHISGFENQGNRHSTITNKILPNNPVKVTNREYLERKIINNSQNYQKFIEEDMCSEVSWNVVKPEKEFERRTMVKEIFANEMPTETVSGEFSKSYQAKIEANQVRKRDQMPKPSQNDISYPSNYCFNFQENNRSVKKGEGTETLPKYIPNPSTDEDKKGDQMPKSFHNDISYPSNYRFNFQENIRSVKKEEGTETVPKFIPKSSTDEFCVTENLSFIRSAKLKEERAQKKSLLIEDAKEVADLIVGSHTAVDIFRSFYIEWLELREESINLLEKIMVAIVKCGGKNENISTLIAGLNIAANAAAFIPHRGVTIGAKIAAAIGTFVAKLFGNEFSEKDRNAKEFEVRQTFQKDIDTSSMVYIYGVQCSSQFEDTCRAIKSLHQRTHQDNFELFMTDASVIKFLREISEYNPSNVTVFYKRLRFEYEMLLKCVETDEGRAFTRVFEDIPQAVPVIDLLPWKFEPDGFDNSIVMNAWEELFSLFNDKGMSSNDEFLRRVQNCLFFLKKEKAILKRNVQSLLK